MAKQTEEEVTLAYYLPQKFVEEAVKLHMPGIFIGDVIQEGNVSLMLYLGENKKANRSRSAGAGARWNAGDAGIPHRRKTPR